MPRGYVAPLPPHGCPSSVPVCCSEPVPCTEFGIDLGQIQQLERENRDLATRLERSHEDQGKLGVLLQERSAEAVDASRRVTDLETELARLKMDRALQAGRSPFSPNASFDVAATASANSSFVGGRKAAAQAAQPLAQQMHEASLAAALAASAAAPAPAPVTSATDGGSDGSHRSEMDAVVPSLDTSQVSPALSEQVGSVSTRGGGEVEFERVLDVSMDEEWRMADHAYLSLNERARKLETLRDALDERLRKGALRWPARSPPPCSSGPRAP